MCPNGATFQPAYDCVLASRCDRVCFTIVIVLFHNYIFSN